jgi:hypothetical protein
MRVGVSGLSAVAGDEHQAGAADEVGGASDCQDVHCGANRWTHLVDDGSTLFEVGVSGRAGRPGRRGAEAWRFYRRGSGGAQWS